METARWITITILLTLLAMLLQVAGYVAPMWIWIQVDEDFLVGVGLWFTYGCGLPPSTCNTTTPDIVFGYDTADTYGKPQFDAVRALETLGLAGVVLLVLFLIVYRLGFGKWDRMEDLNRAAFILCIFSWLTIAVGLIVYCAYYWPVVGTSPLLSSISFPWSMLMCLFAALLLIVICVLIRVKCRQSQFNKHLIPISGDAKMELNPVTKTGLLSRYFTPSPYREDRRTTYALSAYYDEGTNLHGSGMTRQLIAPEPERRVAAIDNVAYQGTEVVQNGAPYRYLPVQNGGVTQTETVVRRTVPTRVITYTDAPDVNQLQQQQHHQEQATTSRVVTYVTDTSATNQIGRETNAGYATAVPPSQRDSGMNQAGYGQEYTGGGAHTEVVERVHYVQQPVVTRTYITAAGNRDSRHMDYATVDDRAGYPIEGRPVANANYGAVSTNANYGHVSTDTRIADNTTDERFTMEGRMMANVNYLAPELRAERARISLSQWESSTTSGLARGQYTTHTVLGGGQSTAVTGSRLVVPAPSSAGGFVKGYDPTYIYRPYSEQIY